MSDPILADQFRAFAYKTYVEPVDAPGAEIRIRAGDVHTDMGFAVRVPLVAGSLRAKQFREQYGLELIAVEGQPVSPTTTFLFRKVSPAGLTAAPSGPVWAEVISPEHGHGGLGWELGRWLCEPGNCE